ncbi:N4-gp56 family major capsid protein [Salipiger sp.]|uniref:N4-gp56 family major capsid protein n=1 Tax=Salipiger sp. TaxID=2078585 RepID=UPI003A987332
MSATVIAWGDPKAQKKWGTELARDTVANQYWARKFVGKGENNIIEQKTELEADSGDRVSFDLSVELRQEPTEGDDVLDGKEEHLRFFTDEVAIDQTRKSVSCGGRMTRKRTVHDLRMVGKKRLKEYWAKYWDELYFIYLSGARGINEAFKVGLGWTGRAGNALQAPDNGHVLFGGDAHAKAEIVAADKMTRDTIERANVAASMMHALDPESASMVPVTVEGENLYVCVMSEFQCYDMRMDTGTGGWLDIQKAAAASEGSSNRIFKGSLGKLDKCVLHSHENVIRFSDYGAGADVPAARALYLGRQAGMVAYGTTKGRRGIWVEDTKDFENQPRVAGGFIQGFKKTRFNGRDFGVMAIDTAARNPNAA